MAFLFQFEHPPKCGASEHVNIVNFPGKSGIINKGQLIANKNIKHMPQETIYTTTPEYNKAKLEFTEIMENPKLGLDKKLESLEKLADQIGINTKNVEDFNNNLERWIKTKDIKLYEAYNAALQEAA
jgi:hypothetical protein